MELVNKLESIHILSAEARAALEEIITVKRFPRNAMIQQVGSSCRTVYFVKEGAARIFYYKDGIDITEHFAFTHEVIVRAESLFTGKPTMKGIQAIEDCTICGIDSLLLFRLYDQFHDLERLFRIIFEQEYVNAIRRIESLQFKSAKERYLDLLKTTDLVQKIPLKYIASYLGITQVSLSRIRADIS